MWLQDTRVIQQAHGFDILAQQHEVLFRCGTPLVLHPVCSRGHACTFLRAVQLEGLRWIVFDLRPLHPDIEGDMLTHLPRDVPGIVYYTLRLTFPSARAFADQVYRQALAHWWTAPAPVPTQVRLAA